MSLLRNPFAPFDAALAAAFESNIEAALLEDVGTGDVTGKLVPEQEFVHARVVVREAAVLCGAPWFECVMKRLDARIQISCVMLKATSCKQTAKSARLKRQHALC
mgnify:CR=1 FL=1